MAISDVASSIAGDSVELREARKPLDGADLAEGEGAIIAVVVAPGEPDPGPLGVVRLAVQNRVPELLVAQT